MELAVLPAAVAHTGGGGRHGHGGAHVLRDGLSTIRLEENVGPVSAAMGVPPDGLDRADGDLAGERGGGGEGDAKAPSI